MSVSRSQLLAVVYVDGFEADKILSDFGYSLRASGLRVAGLVQLNKFVRNRARCDMEIEELSSGVVLRLSEDRGAGARGCRLDRSALTHAAALLTAALDDAPGVVIINKFGKVEAQGGGTRDVIAAAVQLELPVIVGVPRRNLDPWREFVGNLAEEVSVDPLVVRHWLSARLGNRWVDRPSEFPRTTKPMHLP